MKKTLFMLNPRELEWENLTSISHESKNSRERMSPTMLEKIFLCSKEWTIFCEYHVLFK
jgi:hypothetical protein